MKRNLKYPKIEREKKTNRRSYKKHNKTFIPPNSKLTCHRQLDTLDEEPAFLGPHSIHHYEALVVPRVSNLNILDDQGTVPRVEFLQRHLHPALKLRRLPLVVPELFEHGVWRRHPLDVAVGLLNFFLGAFPAAGKDHLAPHHGHNGHWVGTGGQSWRIWRPEGFFLQVFPNWCLFFFYYYWKRNSKKKTETCLIIKYVRVPHSNFKTTHSFIILQMFNRTKLLPKTLKGNVLAFFMKHLKHFPLFFWQSVEYLLKTLFTLYSTHAAVQIESQYNQDVSW